MNVWNFILAKHLAHIPVILLTVLESKGSSPGRQGFKMAIAADNSMNGSIGGGIMEHKFVEMARDHLTDNKKSPGIFRQIHDKSAAKNQSGMICSGEQTIFFYPVHHNDQHAIQTIAASIQNQDNGTLVLNNFGISFYADPPGEDYYFKNLGDDFVYKEKTGHKNILHIIGGGHCALALSRIMSEMDFQINIYDDRPSLNTLENNIYADKKNIVESYQQIKGMIDEGNNVYVVIMTFGYRSDDMLPLIPI